MKQPLRELLKEVGEKAELKSHRETPDERYKVNASAFTRLLAEFEIVKEILNSIIVLTEKKDGNYDITIRKDALPEEFIKLMEKGK